MTDLEKLVVIAKALPTLTDEQPRHVGEILVLVVSVLENLSLQIETVEELVMNRVDDLEHRVEDLERRP